MGKIGYLNIPEFPVAVERVCDVGVRDCALVIAPLNSDRAKIWAASTEAKESGIFKGMAVAQAKRLSPGLLVIEPRPDLYARANRSLLDIFRRDLPLFELEREGKVFFDFEGMENLRGSLENYAFKLKSELSSRLRLSSSLGLASNKLVSKTAAKLLCHDLDIGRVKDGLEEKFLAPLPGEVLPSVQELKKNHSKERVNLLSELSLNRVEDLKLLDLKLLSLVFGSQASLVFDHVRGHDQTRVRPMGRRDVIFEEAMLANETNHFLTLFQTILGLSAKSFERLRKLDKTTGAFRLGVRYSDYKTHFVVQKMKYSVSFSCEIESLLENCLRSLLKRRTTVRYLCLELDDLKKSEVQLDLFGHCEKAKQIEGTLDLIKARFGDCIRLGKTG